MTTQEPEHPDTAPPSPLQADRRGAERHSCDLMPFWLVLGDGESASHPASIRDLSATGVGLVVKQALKPGMVLVITLQRRDNRVSRPLPVRVMHATCQKDGDWVVGCRFVRALSNQDMAALLAEE